MLVLKPSGSFVGYYGQTIALAVVVIASSSLLVGVIGLLLSAIEAVKFLEIPTDENGEINVDDPKTKEAIETWVELFRKLIYCKVMTYYESEEDWGKDNAGNLMPAILFFG